MTLHNAMRGTIALLATFLLACAKGEQSNAAADSTARNLTLAPSPLRNRRRSRRKRRRPP